MSKVAFTGNVSGTGTFTIASPNGNTDRTITLPDATGTMITTGSLSSVTPAMLTQSLTLGTAQASTSGTSIDFTGIPSWVKRITVMFNGVSLSGTSDVLVQLGTSGGIDATGYSGSGIFVSTGGAGRTATTGYLVYLSSAARVFIGAMVITNLSGNLWVEQTTGSDSATNSIIGGGVKTLSATLTQLRVTSLNGTDTFDAGSVNILYEG